MRSVGTVEESVVEDLRAVVPALAAAGLRLGVALAGEPQARPAGPAEAAEAARMAARRRAEFLAGRLAARRALRAAGLECGEIPRAGRKPLFPAGCAVSISHSGGVAVAVAGLPGRGDEPVGCDLELYALPARAARLVLTEDERLRMGQAAAAGPAAGVTVWFSAKEAAFKALGDGPRHLGDLEVRPLPGGFAVAPRTEAARALDVRWVPAGTGVFTYVRGWVRDGDGPQAW
jgi:4'-phosphopantetheinyl transferase EntD